MPPIWAGRFIFGGILIIFGLYLKENLDFLEKILKHYADLNKQGKIENKTMEEIAKENLL